MAIMTGLRNRMRVVIWALLFLFVLSMTIGGLVGGANIIDQILGRISPNEAIGAVNGDIITPAQFNQTVSARLDAIRSSGQEVTERHIDNIRNDVWNAFIEEKLMQQTIENMNITVSDEEILYHLEHNPPPDIQQLFMVNNTFDGETYHTALNTSGMVDWAPIELWMREFYIPRFKLQQFLNMSAVVTEEDILREFIKNNVAYTIKALHVTTRIVSENISEPSDSELREDYSLRMDDFKRAESRNLSYVRWDKSPSVLDSTQVYSEALDIIEQSRNGEKFAYLANLYTMDPSNQVFPDSGRGGNLGWFGKGQMVKAFDEAVFSAKPGDVVGPILTHFGYHIIKVDSIRGDKSEPQVKASHILLKIEMGPGTKSELRRQAILFSYDAQDTGFEVAVDSHLVSSFPINSIHEKDVFLSTIGPFRSAVKFAYSSVSGDISEILENDQFFAVFKLDSIIPEGVIDFEQVRDQIHSKILDEKQRHAAEEFAFKMRGLLDNGATFEKLKAENDLLDLISTDRKKLNESFISLGRSQHLIGALLNSKEDDLIGPIPTYRGFGLVKVMAIEEIDSTSWNIQKDVIQTNLKRKKQNKIYSSWMADMKEKAKIVDNRKYFF